MTKISYHNSTTCMITLHVLNLHLVLQTNNWLLNSTRDIEDMSHIGKYKGTKVDA
jgi:hypothetical protein